jgi:hypothetical protein
LSYRGFTIREKNLEAQARELYEDSPSFREPWEILPDEEQDYWLGCAKRDADTDPFAHVEDENLRNHLNAQFDALVERACCDYVLNQKLSRRRYVGLIPRRTIRFTRTRSYRRPRRSALARAVGDDGGDGSGQGDPDPSDPPKRYPSVIFPARENYNSPSPWPRHGCCRVERGRSA